MRGELRRISRERPRWGYRRAHQLLLDEGWQVNRKRTQRLWREEGLRVPRRRRKRQRLGDSTVPARRLRAEGPDHVWALDFQFDHKVPVARGGAHALGNLVVACPRCNAMKGRLSAGEYLELLALLRDWHPAARQDLERRLLSGGTRYRRR